MFIDTHAHLYMPELAQNLDELVERASVREVEKIICVGTDLSSSKQSIAIAEQYPQVFATVGIHPHDAKDAPTDFKDQICELVSHPKAVALGEMGLDFTRNYSPRLLQKEVFIEQLELAGRLNLPVIVHNRQADDEIMRIIEEVGWEQGVMHCFSGSLKMAEQVIEFGFHLSFTGNITFGKNSYESVIAGIPLSSMMLETDCPFLAPIPKRGTVNEPANILYIAEKVSRTMGLSVEEVAKATTETAMRFFHLPR